MTLPIAGAGRRLISASVNLFWITTGSLRIMYTRCRRTYCGFRRTSREVSMAQGFLRARRQKCRSDRDLSMRPLKRLLTGWSLVRIRPGEPNLRFCQIGPFAGCSLRGYGRRFCQQVKWLPQIGNHLPALPGAVRNYEIEKPTFFARFLLLEQSLSIPREFKQPDAFLKVGSIGGLMPFDFAKTPILLGAPFGRHAIKECGVHLAIELVHIHGMHAALKSVVFGPQPANCRFVFPLLVDVTRAQGVARPSEDFLVEGQPAEQFRELLADDLL